MEQGGEGISGVDEVRAAGPSACPNDAVVRLGGAPKGYLVDTCWLVRHDFGLEPHVAHEIQGARLDAIGTASAGGLRSVVDVLDAVAPACQACREHEASGPGANNDCRRGSENKKGSASVHMMGGTPRPGQGKGEGGRRKAVGTNIIALKAVHGSAQSRHDSAGRSGHDVVRGERA